MEWYEIIGLLALWVLGLYLRGKLIEYRRDYYRGYNGSWKNKKREIEKP